MCTVELTEAADTLPDLIRRAGAGEHIVIAREGVPLVALVPVDAARESRVLGIWEGRVRLAPDWDGDEVNSAIADEYDRPE